MNEEDLQRLKPQELLQMIEQQAGLARSMTDYMLPTNDVDWRNPQPLVEFGDFVVYARFKDQPSEAGL